MSDLTTILPSEGRGFLDGRLMEELRVSFGIRQNGSVVHVSELSRSTERGLSCRCMCAACGDRLIARLGDVRQHHFAHAAVHECATGDESALHRFAKEVFLRHKSVVVPEHLVHVGDESAVVSESLVMPYIDVAIEKRIAAITPDAILEREGRPPMLIEIGVAHFVDEDKRRKLEMLGFPCIEVDLSDLLSADEFDREFIEEALIHGSDRKRWVFHPGAAATRAALEESVRQRAELRERQRRDAQEREARARERMQRERARAMSDEYQQGMAAKTERELPTNSIWLANRKAFAIPDDAPTPWYLGFEAPGEYLFTVHRTVWQSALFRVWVFNKRQDGRSRFVSVKFALAQLREAFPEIWEKCLYWAWKDDARVLPPATVVGGYFKVLERCGFLEGDDNWGRPYSWTFSCVRPQVVLLPPEYNSPRFLPRANGIVYDTQNQREIGF